MDVAAGHFILGTRVLKRLIFGAAALALAGCQTAAESFARQRPATSAEKASIVAGARNVMRDPYSIRDAEISYYVPHGTGDNGHICVVANAKNAFGAYTGRKGWLVAMVNGQAANAWEGHPMCNIAQMRYQPFPEIYKLRAM